MTLYPYPANAATIAHKIKTLTEYCKGPRNIKNRLANWADQLAAQSTDCFTESAFSVALKDLLVLSYSNSLVNLLPAPPFQRTHRGLEVDDTGGYLAARLIIRDLVIGAPLSPERKADAAELVLRTNDAHVENIQALLSVQ